MAAKMKVLLENWNKFLLEEEKKDSDPCWEDYKKVGTKEKNGEEVPNCVLKKKMQESPCSNSSGMNYEEGPEASMHRTSLYTISQDANELLGLIGEEDDLPEWLESKIVLAQEYLSAARDYLSGEMGRQAGSLEEMAKSKAQQRFFGMMKKCKEEGNCSGEMQKKADSMSSKDIDDFASTKHKGLPRKVNEEELDEGGRCTGPTDKAPSDRKGKKWQKCEKQPDGSYKRIHWGQAGVRVGSGNSERAQAFNARMNCDNPKPGTPQEQSCKAWK